MEEIVLELQSRLTTDALTRLIGQYAAQRLGTLTNRHNRHARQERAALERLSRCQAPVAFAALVREPDREELLVFLRDCEGIDLGSISDSLSDRTDTHTLVYSDSSYVLDQLREQCPDPQPGCVITITRGDIEVTFRIVEIAS